LRYEHMLRRLVEYLARKASMIGQKRSLEDTVGPAIAPMLEKSFEKIALSIARDNGGTFWCRLCDRGPFTKRGFYLHLIRVHYRDLEYLVEEELKRALEVVRR